MNMAFKKKYKRNSITKKKYTAEEKLSYYSKRAKAPGRFNLEFGGPKHCYADGFREAFLGHNNESGIRYEFGNKSGNSYALGYKRGEKTAHEYFKKTGNQPYDLGLKY